MLNLKKTAVAVLAFGSSAVFAGTMGPVCAPGNVTVPCAHTAWDFGVQALYLQPSFTGFDHVGSQINANGAENFVTNSPNYNWGFKLEGSYHFNTGNDVNLNWYHLGSAGTNRSFLTPAAAVANHGTFFDAFGGVWAPNGGVSVAGNSNWDAVNLEFGQHVDFGEFTNIRFHGGLEFARFNANVDMAGMAVSNSTANANGLPAVAFQSLGVKTSYNGVGPRLGADMSYDWNNGLGVYANGAMAMLVGTSQFTLNNINGLPGQIIPQVNPNTPLAFSTKGSTTTINPALEGKLGATYTYAMAQGDLSLDLGWMWVNYFRVLSTGTLGKTHASDFGVQGPFVGLKWLGNVA